MRAGTTAGRSCGSGWSDVDGDARAAAILLLTTLPRRAALDPAAAIRAAQAPSFHRHGHVPGAPFRKASIETGAPIGPYAALDAMPDLRVLLHGTNL